MRLVLQGVEALDDSLGGAGGWKAVALPDGVRQGTLCRGSSFDAEVVGLPGLCNGVGCGGEWDAEAALAERARIAVLGFERSDFRARRGQDDTAFGDFGLERSCSGDGSDDGSLRLARLLPTLSTDTDVRDFAKAIGIAPGIVVGRLQHEELWGWNRGHDFKRGRQIVDS